jgi:hypothetical protein
MADTFVAGRVNAGFTIIAQGASKGRDTIVLGFRSDRATVEYVTWFYQPQTGGYSSGHYFGNDIVAAVADYKNRLDK